MPAAAVIPAPIAYIKAVAVKKLVVDSPFWTDGAPPGVSVTLRTDVTNPPARTGCSSPSVPGGRHVYFEKIRVLKAGYLNGLNGSAWNNGIGPRFYFIGFLSPR